MMISKMGIKKNLRLITKNHAADPEIVFLEKSFSKPYGPYGMAHTVWAIPKRPCR